jgi:hypothetical protein
MDFFNSLYSLKETYNQDFIRLNYMDIADKLTWKITAQILVVLILIVFNAKEFVNKVISCAVPMYFSPNQEEYANEICFITNKYYVNENHEIFLHKSNETLISNSLLKNNFNGTITINDRTKVQNVSYYLWIPYILLLQGFLFLVPEKLWYLTLNFHTKIDIKDLLRASLVFENKNKKNNAVFDCSIQYILLKDPSYKYIIQNISKEMFSLKYSKKLFFTYIVIKLFNITLTIANIYTINFLLEITSFDFMTNMTHNLISNFFSKGFEINSHRNSSYNHYIDSTYFPIKSLCLFRIRELGSINNLYAVMCALPLNMFIKYLFFFLFSWYIIIIIIQVYCTIRFIKSYSHSSRYLFSKKYLLKIFNSKRKLKYTNFSNKDLLFNQFNKLTRNEKKKKKLNYIINNFNEFLTIDFIFLLNIIESNININNYFIENILFYYFEIFLKFYLK